MLCAAIDIGSNTTRVLVAELIDGQLKKVMEQRAYTRISKAIDADGAITAAKVDEVGELVATQVRLAQELGAVEIRAVATAAVREATQRAGSGGGDLGGRRGRGRSPERRGGGEALLHRRDQGARPPGRRADRRRRHRRRLDRGDPRHASPTGWNGCAPGTSAPGILADALVEGDPPSAAEIRRVRDHIEEFFDGVVIPHPAQAVAVGGSATSLRRLVGAVLEYETLERGIRILSTESSGEVARRFELDPRRVRILTTGVLLLEKVSELLGQPLQIGKGGLREGIILDLFAGGGSANGSASARLAA